VAKFLFALFPKLDYVRGEYYWLISRRNAWDKVMCCFKPTLIKMLVED
jgi:hypothetical protein